VTEAPPSAQDPEYDQARVSVLVEVPPELAFQIFTEDIDRWWRRGLRYRVARGRDGAIHLEPRVGGRLYESLQAGGDTALKPTGTVTVWEPPRRLTFEWRAVNFEPSESTLVDVEFKPTRSGTLVIVTHSGWTHIRADHPVRHGQGADEFVRRMALWWGELMASLREVASAAKR
jgi:uncharacterized protein YndB with AHSA1/START domain